jgi:hypothetical protein
VDFAAVLDRIAGFLAPRGARWALVGGVGLAALGVARTTLDLDLAVESAVQEDLVAFMEQTGYETLHRSSGYSNHLHADPSLGRVDFVYLDAATAERLFAGCRDETGPGDRTLLVPRPEHLAAMKILAMKNDPARAFQELADIRALLALPGVDREEVRGYFARHGLAERFDELAATL